MGWLICCLLKMSNGEPTNIVMRKDTQESICVVWVQECGFGETGSINTLGMSTWQVGTPLAALQAQK